MSTYGRSPEGRKKILYSLYVSAMSLLLPAVVFAQNASEDCRTALEKAAGIPPTPCVPGFILGPAGNKRAGALLVDLINVSLAVVGLLSVLFLIFGGFRYVTAHGNEELAEAAKKTITNSIIGLVIVIMSFVIVRVITTALTLGSA